MLALRIGLISQHVWLLAHSDKAKAALGQARQLAWEHEADRFEKHQLAHLSQPVPHKHFYLHHSLPHTN